MKINNAKHQYWIGFTLFVLLRFRDRWETCRHRILTRWCSICFLHILAGSVWRMACSSEHWFALLQRYISEASAMPSQAESLDCTVQPNKHHIGEILEAILQHNVQVCVVLHSSIQKCFIFVKLYTMMEELCWIGLNFILVECVWFKHKWLMNSFTGVLDFVFTLWTFLAT